MENPNHLVHWFFMETIYILKFDFFVKLFALVACTFCLGTYDIFSLAFIFMVTYMWYLWCAKTNMVYCRKRKKFLLLFF